MTLVFWWYAGCFRGAASSYLFRYGVLEELVSLARWVVALDVTGWTFVVGSSVRRIPLLPFGEFFYAGYFAGVSLRSALAPLVAGFGTVLETSGVLLARSFMGLFSFHTLGFAASRLYGVSCIFEPFHDAF